MSFVERGLERDRIAAGIGVIAVHALFAWALISGLRIGVPQAVRDELKLFNVLPAPPPPPPEKYLLQRIKAKKAEGKASPPNLRSKATDVTAPKPIIALPVPPPIIVAQKPGPGVQAISGAADVPGPGTGAGGIGNGFGSGGRGNGEGGEEDDGVPPRLVKGRLKFSDSSRVLQEAGVVRTPGSSYRVGVVYRVGVDGRVTNCRVNESSGYSGLDQTTCRLIEQRFRFAPARDERGKPVDSTIEESHTFVSTEGPDTAGPD